MIGFYDYTVIATYCALVFGMSGIFAAAEGREIAAVLCLLLAGLLDAFDGRIARTKKNRTANEKRFGIQLDSLNDVICFGVLPACLGFGLGHRQWWYLTSLCFFALTALIRLAYFNVLEEERQDATNEKRSHYLGMPVTMATLFVPLLYILYSMSESAAVWAVGLFLLGVLFIAPIRVKKAGMTGILLMSVLGLGEFLWIFFVL